MSTPTVFRTASSSFPPPKKDVFEDSGDTDGVSLSSGTSGVSSNTSSPPLLAFNGNTFVRPNKKERKGLYFTEPEVNKSPSQIIMEGPPGHARQLQFEADERKEQKVVPTLKFSSPTSTSTTTDEEPTEDTFHPEEKLITFHEVSSGKRRNSNSSKNSSRNINMPGNSSSHINHLHETSQTSVKDEEVEEVGEGAGGSGGATGSHNYSMSTEENFECFGESGSFSVLDNSSATESSSLQNFRDLNDSDLTTSPGSGNPHSLTNRSAWQRTSLRRTPNNLNGEGMNHRRWGSFRSSNKRGAPAVASSNALANQLYRSSSYHSSGRSSAGDGEEMYSDSSLEGEVIDLNKKVHHLEERFTVLAENQNDVDDRYTRAKQENAELSTKLFMLEEQLRDEQQRSDEKLREEQRRHKDILNRTEREKQLQMENLEIRLQGIEKELSLAKIENKRLEGSLERERNEKNHLNDKCAQNEREISSLREHNRELLNQNREDRESLTLEKAGSQQALSELKQQLASLSQFHVNKSSHSLRRNDSSESETSDLKSRLKEAEEEIRRLKQKNKELTEANEDLSAQIMHQGLENGRNLLMNLNTSTGGHDNSLAAELEAMSNDETDEYGFSSKRLSESDAMAKMKSALKDQKEANLALRTYIDGILLNIVEHYPQLLEVKNKNHTNGNNGMSIMSNGNSSHGK